jgi:UDP-2-acetamido-3-amino-2,3-dideoxy-glucuronate N-acetyltransferase
MAGPLGQGQVNITTKMGDSTLIQKERALGRSHASVITIGRYAAIGAGVVVTKDVPRHALFYGNPATIQGYVCRCGQKLVIKEGLTICLHCKAKYKATHGKLLV